MRNDRRDLGDVQIRPAQRADAQAIMLAHLDSIRSLGPAFYPSEAVEAWSAGLIPAVHMDAMGGGEAFFIATGMFDGEITVLGFSTHRVEDAHDGASVYVRGRAARRGIGTQRHAEDHARAHGAGSLQIRQASLVGGRVLQSQRIRRSWPGSRRPPVLEAASLGAWDPHSALD
jgi:hypothetical protein